MSTCIRCKEHKDLSSFWICKKEIYCYCKPCYTEYINDRFGSYKDQYIYLKDKNGPITCNCGKTITKPYWYNNHLKLEYHIKHIKLQQYITYIDNSMKCECRKIINKITNFSKHLESNYQKKRTRIFQEKVL